MTPTVVGERLFAGSCSGSFFAFDRKRGGVLWLYDTSTDGHPANFHGEPLITDELIVVGSDVDWVLFPESDTERVEYVYAFEQSSGRVRWKHGATAGVISEIVRRGETVYGVTKDGELLALALADGRLRFSIRTGEGSADASIRYSVLVHNDRVIWEQTTSTEWTSFRPVKLGDRVLVSNEEGELLALDAESGTVSGRWLFAGGIRGFSVADGVLYVGTLGGKLYAYPMCDGAGRSICLRSADDSHGKGRQF